MVIKVIEGKIYDTKKAKRVMQSGCTQEPVL